MKKTYNKPAIVVAEIKIKQNLLSCSAPAPETLNPTEEFDVDNDEVGARGCGFSVFDDEY